jgi:hypothetical protein
MRCRLLDDYAVVPWYTSDESYQQFRDSAVDCDDFFDRFDQWADAAIAHERAAELRGVMIFRVRMSFPDFQAWCQTHGRVNNNESRSAFAEYRAAQLMSWKSD